MAFAIRGPGFVRLLPGLVEQPRPENLHRDRAVLVLRFLRTGDNDSRRDVGYPHCRVGGVHVLTTGAACAHGVDTDVRGRDVDVDFLGLWQHCDRCGGGVDAALTFRLRDPLHAVHTGFELEPGRKLHRREMARRFP